MAFIGCEKKTNMQITELKCESVVEPVGIDILKPKFSWILENRERGQNQTAYQIIVADNNKDIKQNKGNFWDSGKTGSAKSFAIQYNGKPLTDNHTFYWKVKLWDKNDQPTNFSQTASFTTSILDSKLWKGNWIGRGIAKAPLSEEGFYQEKIDIDEEGDSIKYNGNSLLLRKQYNCDLPVENAIVNVSGLGYYELFINGNRMGEKVLNPAKTNYNQIVLFDTYDVTELLNKGENIIGIHLGNGWFNPIPKWWSWRMQWFGEKQALLNMHITYVDGSTELIYTNNTWKIADGPITHHCIYDGETYDATKEILGWDKPGFDDSSWKFAQVVASPSGKLTAQLMPPIQRIETIHPVSITYPNDSSAVVDFGQNFSGWVKIKIKGKRGQKTVIRYAENIKNGAIDTKSNSRAVATDTYIAKGETEETFEPHFTYHGFQFAEISGLDYKLQAKDIQGIVVHSSVKPVGKFECSHEGINKIHNAILWSYRSNAMGYPTDCPQREERLGWIGDAHVVAETGIYNFDVNRFYHKWLRDIRKNQNKTNGYIPYIAPRPISKGNPAFSWSSGFHLITWYHYLYYGDVSILKENYIAMKNYVDYLSSLADGYILPNDKYGDWVSPLEGWERGAPASISTGYYYYISTIVQKAAQILGFEKDARYYGSLAVSIRKAFNQKYYNEVNQQYEEGSQFSNSFALFLGLVPESEKEAVLNNLVNDIINTHNTHLTTGILGTKYLIEALSREGRSDIAWALASQTTFPSWIDVLKNKTTLCERWDQSGSSNHVMLGSIDAWFYKTLAGIQVDENKPGFKNVVIKPFMPDGLDWVKASVKTIRGTIRSEWKNSAESYHLKVNIPVGTNGKVYVLTDKVEQVTEGGTPVKDGKDITFLRMENGYAVFWVASGEYEFFASK